LLAANGSLPSVGLLGTLETSFTTRKMNICDC